MLIIYNTIQKKELDPAFLWKCTYGNSNDLRPLEKLALKLYSMVPTTASLKRSMSPYQNGRERIGKGLSEANMMNLVTIRNFAQQKEPGYGHEESSAQGSEINLDRDFLEALEKPLPFAIIYALLRSS